jgi:NitT/TauT family transport system substrate-binding protein
MFPRMSRLTHLVLWYGMISVMFGCDRGGNAVTSGAKPPLAEVRLGYFPNITHAQAVLGVSSGDFATAVGPTKFTSRIFKAGPSLIEALFSHDIDVGYVGPGPAINAFVRSHGEGIRVISGAADNGVLIVARKGSAIHTMAELKGRKLATPQQGNTQDISARHYLSSTLHQDDLSNVVPIANADQASLMSAGQIDAAWVPEPWGSVLIAKANATMIGEEKNLWPGRKFALTVIVTTPEFLNAHADIVEKLLAVNHTWTTRLAADPTKYLPQLEAGLKPLNDGKSLPPGVAKQALSHVLFTEDPSFDTFVADAQWSADLKYLRTRPDLTTLIDLSVLKRTQSDERKMQNEEGNEEQHRNSN